MWVFKFLFGHIRWMLCPMCSYYLLLQFLHHQMNEDNAAMLMPTMPPIAADDRADAATTTDTTNNNNNDSTTTTTTQADALLVDDDDDEDVEEEDASKQIEHRDKEDNVLVEECIEEEIEKSTSTSVEQSTHVATPWSNKVHKKKSSSDYINEGVPLPEKDGRELESDEPSQKARAKKKSMDRESRVRGANRHGNQTDSAVDSVVTRAFNRFACDGGTDPESGIDRHDSDDFCAVLIKAKPERGTNMSKIVRLVVCECQRFGGINGAQLALSWPREDDEHRATVNIVSVAEHFDIASELCVRSAGEIVASLKNVDSSCIAPIKPSLEETIAEDGDIAMNAVFRVSEVSSVLADVSEGQLLHHNVTDDCTIPPIVVKNKSPFVDVTSDAAEQLVCNVCDPPVAIGKADYDKDKMQRAIRNHMAAHQLINEGDVSEEPCAFCARPSCKLQVTGLSDHVMKNIITKHARIPPSAKAHPNCITYPSIKPFDCKFCKPIKTPNFPTSNQPWYCSRSKMFIWSHDVELHYKNHHGGLHLIQGRQGEDASSVDGCVVENAEKFEVIKSVQRELKVPSDKINAALQRFND